VTTPAWYVIPSPRWWARWLNALHFPYTAWHLSYPVLGAMLAETVNWAVLGWTVLAFFLGMGVAAHCADLLNGDPLKLGLRRRHLEVVAVAAVLAAVGIGVWQLWAGNVPQAVALAIPVGALLSSGYGKEWPGLHGDRQFATWWAVFPLMVGYFSQGVALCPALGPALTFALASAYAQRVLSTRARFLRRRVGKAMVSLEAWHEEHQEYLYGRPEFKPWLLAPLDQALMWLSLMMVSLAAGLVVFRLFG
jgi:hypothetical protein